jgi:hypothetical protein
MTGEESFEYIGKFKITTLRKQITLNLSITSSLNFSDCWDFLIALLGEEILPFGVQESRGKREEGRAAAGSGSS